MKKKQGQEVEQQKNNGLINSIDLKTSLIILGCSLFMIVFFIVLGNAL